MGSKLFFSSFNWVGLPNTQAPAMQKIIQISISTVPYLIFLFFYGMNRVFHILPTLDDLGCIHIHTINNIEGFLLGFQPHKLISGMHIQILDFFSAIPYLLHYVLPVLFPVYLFFCGRYDDISKFYWLLGWVMWAHYLIWMVFPHAPPWVLDHMARNNVSTIAHAMQHREGCAFARLDSYTGIPFFFNMFNGNPIPYASFPSGHIAWPLCVHLVGGPGGNLFVLYIFYMGWATLYSCHHYLLDAIGAVVLVFATRRVVIYLQDRNVCSLDYRCKASGITCPTLSV